MSAKALSRLLRVCLTAMFAAAFLRAGAVHAADAADRAFELGIRKGALPAAQRTLRVGKGDTLRLTVTSDAPGNCMFTAIASWPKSPPASLPNCASRPMPAGAFRSSGMGRMVSRKRRRRITDRRLP